MTKLPELFECHSLRAKITERQCKLNREGYRSRGINFPSITSCQGCAGLGESAHVPAPVQEVSVKKKKIECGHYGCGYGVKKEGDFCKKHQKPETKAVTSEKKLTDVIIDAPAGIGYDDENEKAELAGAAIALSVAEPLHFATDGVCLTACGVVSSSRTLLTDNWDAVTCENCQLWAQLNENSTELDQVSAGSSGPEWVRNDEMAQAMLSLIGCTVGLELLADQPDDQIRAAMDFAGACHLQASDNDDVGLPPMPFFLKGTQTHAPESQNQPVAGTPPKEQVAPSKVVKKGLAALLSSPPAPPAPPAPPVGLHVPFSLDEIAILEEFEVTPDHIRQLVVMGLEGQVCPLDTSDPLAKSRVHAAD